MLLKCKVCNGTGLLENEEFEACKFADPDDLAKMGMTIGDCNGCDPYLYDLCKRGEVYNCTNCSGTGYGKISDELWELAEVRKNQ